MLTLRKCPKLLIAKDYLENNNLYLNIVYQKVLNIRNYPRSNDGSRASSENGEIGKIQSMDKVISYLEYISE